MTQNELVVELEFYKENKEEYLARFPGRFVLIQGRELVGVYLDWSSAMRDGLRMLGNVSMLIKEVVREETTEFVPIRFVCGGK